jgi:hypothetical protein
MTLTAVRTLPAASAGGGNMKKPKKPIKEVYDLYRIHKQEEGPVFEGLSFDEARAEAMKDTTLILIPRTVDGA